jgi:hypothetical protein
VTITDVHATVLQQLDKGYDEMVVEMLAGDVVGIPTPCFTRRGTGSSNLSTRFIISDALMPPHKALLLQSHEALQLPIVYTVWWCAYQCNTAHIWSDKLW